jgi:alkanesulfonate monooxygenase SsuD/methylene tetrahydromethanopterin reductase-like flavin-dependent oxidoreductase (luciferase family)
LALGCFISVGRELETAVERVKLAESLGYESVYVTHIAARDPFTVLTAYAAATERIGLGTGVTPIYARTPVATAQAAATIDEYSDGRMVLGLGVSHRPVVEGWYSQTIDKPVREMREYLSTVRAILRGEDPPPGEKWPTGFRFMGYDTRADLPIYIAGLSPAMLRLAGELADGVILWLCEPGYIREVVVPEVTKGREKAGKGPRRLRHRRRSALGRDRRPRRCPRDDAQGPCALFPPALLQGDDRALRIRTRHREGRRVHRHPRRHRQRRGGERDDPALFRRGRHLARGRADTAHGLRGDPAGPQPLSDEIR